MAPHIPDGGNAQTLENFEKYKSWSLSQMELKFLI